MPFTSDFKTQLISASDRLFSLLDRFQQVRALVVGDLTVDEFVTGQVERLSREAPVLILRHESTRQVPGGGANAVYNLAALGGQVKAVGLVGKDAQGQALRQIFEAAQIDTMGILVDGDRPTVTKTRISGHARQSVTQQIVRVDRKSDALPQVDLQHQLADYIRQQLDQVDVVVCSDYGDGTLTAPVIQAALEHPLSVVDTQVDLHRYPGATIFTPNLPEAEQAAGYAIATPERLQQAGRELLQVTQAQYMLITRGEEGMSLFAPEDSAQTIPAFNRTDVFDVTGAGDTVAAALALALALGATPWEGALLGNLAASIVVRQFGTATTTTDELRVALQDLLTAL
ncbi:MAG: D-glycero-beta-D-manno-heptose-7-phosphate kinase [Leptolyngbya sp. DLM2.Bin15]|nr:MAG: D-glycero-beta-D-manno-heptose-7-phosphate kinase [Leptolyngbya sp. DLM2.Bin15]